MTQRRPMIAGNWKMNLTLDESVVLIETMAKGIKGLSSVDVLVAPPFTSLPTVRSAIGDSGILLGAQNMHWEWGLYRRDLRIHAQGSRLYPRYPGAL